MDILAVSLKGVVPFLLYFVAAVTLLTVFLATYAWITPYREIELIRKGDTAAAVSLSGAMLGFAIPLASAIAHTVVIEEMLMWGAISGPRHHKISSIGQIPYSSTIPPTSIRANMMLLQQLRKIQ